MTEKNLTEQLNDAKRFADLLSKVPEEKRAVVVMMAQAFISGMEAQEQLAAEKVSWKGKAPCFGKQQGA